MISPPSFPILLIWVFFLGQCSSVSFTASLKSWIVFNEPFSYFTCARFCTSFIPLQLMPLELVVSRLAGGQRPRSFWHSRLCFYEPLWIKEHTVHMSSEAPWCGLLESRLNGLETAQGLPQHQGLIAFDLPVRLPLRAISQQPGQALEELPSKLQALSEERPGFLPAEYPQVPYDLGSSQSLGRGRLSPYQVPKCSLASQRGRSLYTLLCRFWSTHGFCVLSSLECIPAFVAYLAQGIEPGRRRDQRQGVCAYPPSVQDSYSHLWMLFLVFSL